MEGYIIWAIVMFVVFSVITLVQNMRGYEFHLHHWYVGAVMMTFIGYRTVALTLANGFFNGIMIEGGARWGFDPIWEKESLEGRTNNQQKGYESSRERVRWIL